MNDLTEAERALIELLRGDTDFTISISEHAGVWVVTLEDHESGKRGEGRGHNFERAWNDNGKPPPPLRVV